MSTLKFDDVKIGDTLPPLTLEPVNRTTLALFAGASGDHNRVHIDTDYARKAGMPDVFAHGMLSMAYLGRLLTRWVDQRQLREFGVRFVGITHLGHQVTCTGRIVDKFEADGERRVKLEIQTANQYGEPRVVGEAVVAL
ncbi:MaoC family dehydratase [Paraburkholderia hospita]|jgi:acyl dehydratase|uniref:MaoC-like dehydratase n=1 Tax=Paraburkholderia hospita TaxID=169430 RepID=A0ABN0FT59_9BURK|nr:MaoC family dehydratase [Paraburkholderia hospita]AXE97536.1 dehydratase [Paraburkholderia hospita]EIN01977.1 putative MaoC-like dehydratase [Paraburkholderia hospita]OUL73420.1 dehydratase [Paraburkholderia hospita]OUL86959.1 dehydratase [Paraburkholderia hospita]OUL92176.1 dehydratase [Paraburkholderia hospita]